MHAADIVQWGSAAQDRAATFNWTYQGQASFEFHLITDRSAEMLEAGAKFKRHK